jgi:hypothetical protein
MDVPDRAEKSVVFSQWEDMLDVVKEALKANMQHGICSSKDASRDWPLCECLSVLSMI